MSLLNVAGEKVNQAFWRTLKAIGFAFNAAGAIALFACFVVIVEQVLGFLRDDHWQSKSLLSAMPDTAVGWLISLGNLSGISLQLVDFLNWIPLSMSAFLAGLGFILIAKYLTREYQTF